MENKTAIMCLMVITAMLPVSLLKADPADVCYYAGSTSRERFQCVFELSDKTILVGGSASDLDWIPVSVPRVELAKTCGNGVAVPLYDAADNSQNTYAFILRLAADARTPMTVYHFPQGFGGTIQTIRTSAVPGRTTGNLYISGFWTNTGNATPTHYWVGKLDQNILSADPARLSWIYKECPAGGDKFARLWDVGGDGKVVFSNYKNPVSGAWHALSRLKADGTGLDTVPLWWDHGEGYNATLSLKPANGDMRSITLVDYNLVTPDGHGGNGKKKGKFPYDYYYKGPKGINDTAGGFTGYSSDGKAATTVAISIDRRSNDMYIGFNNGNPQNTHDFEPMVVAFKSTGEQIWYSHLYTVWNDTNRNDVPEAGEIFQCPPDQYVDDIAIDYSTDVSMPQIVVLARSHGNAPSSFWSGTNSFHNGFTGTNGNEHLGWLGRFRGADGTFVNASWQAEYDPWTNRTSFGVAYSDPNLDGWPDHNKGWPNLKTTRSRSLTIDNSGNVCVIGNSRGPVSSANAFQKATRAGGGGYGCWSDFVRVYKPDFSSLVYSSILSTPWDSATGNRGGGIKLYDVCPVAGGLVVVGFHGADSTGVADGTGPMPVANVPVWAGAIPNNESAVLGRFVFAGGAPVLHDVDKIERERGPLVVRQGSDRVCLEMPVSSYTRVRVELIALNGVRVSLLLDKMMPQGVHRLSWRQGMPCPGRYLVRVTQGDRVRVLPVMLTGW